MRSALGRCTADIKPSGTGYKGGAQIHARIRPKVMDRNRLYSMKELVVLEEGGLLDESESTYSRCICASCVRYTAYENSHRRLLYWGILLPLLWVVNIASLGYCLYGLAHKATLTEACSRDDSIAIISNHRQARNQMRQWLSYCVYALFLYASTVCMLWMVTRIR